MSENNFKGDQRKPNLATVSMYIGIGSLVALLASIGLGFLVESIGIVSFLGIASVLAVAAIVCGIMARKKAAAEKLPGIRAANTGIILGGITLFLTLILRIAVFLFFIPWLGA